MSNPASDFNSLLKGFIAHSAENGDLSGTTDHMTVGFVVDTDDPLQMGRLRVFCPSYNDDPKKLLHLPWCAYVMPFGGAINNNNYARGSVEDSESSSGAIHYGFWGIPEIGAHVLVGCINGDPRRRFWAGCFPSHQETHTLGHGRYEHTDDTVDGPISSSKAPIEPTYSKLREAFADDIGSAEWKTRGADYQITANTEAPRSDQRDARDDDFQDIQDNEIDDHVKEILGEHGYDWTGYKSLGAFLASRVQSWTSPGFHSITVDDRPFNCRIRIRTTGGNQIILDDTNERMYFSTSGGKSWLEMDAAGNIDVYAERRLSVHAEKDINFSAGESIRMKAGTFISMYAGNNTGQTPLENPIPTGDIRIQASNDMHLKVENNLQMNTSGDLKATVVGETDLSLQGEVNIGSAGAFNIISFDSINLSAPDVVFTINAKNTSIDTLTSFLDDFVETFNDHTHVNAGANLDPQTIMDTPDPYVVTLEADATELAAWTNRVPQHEPWPRVMKQDSDDTVNEQNDGYTNNVDWIDQYDNIVRDNDPSGREPIGKVEGDEEIDRGKFWRR
jgi:hypothetical protein